jgi:drug/metabolite transporter (DMT)-like permease
MEFEFSGEIWFWKGPAPFHFVTVPDDECTEIHAVASQVTYGWGVIPVTARIGRYGPMRVTAWTLWIGTVGLVLAAIPSVARTDFSRVTPVAWGAVAYAGFISLSVAYLLWYRGVQQIGSARTAVYSNMVPVVALLVAWLWLGEKPTALQGLGAAVILGGISIARMGTSRQLPAPSARGQGPEFVAS